LTIFESIPQIARSSKRRQSPLASSDNPQYSACGNMRSVPKMLDIGGIAELILSYPHHAL
jgi:hypothetical protein